MTGKSKEIKKTYDDALAKLQAVLFAQDASKAEKKAAKQSLNDLTAAMLAQNLKTVEGRTALLSALIVELQEITASIEVDSKIVGIAKDLTGLLDQAKEIFKEEKKKLV